MKLADLEVGAHYEASIGYRAGRDRWPDRAHNGWSWTGQVEVVELRVHREVTRNGWRQLSKRPDGVLVRPLFNGEDLEATAIIRAADIHRPWSEAVAETAERAADAAKIKRRREAHTLRVQQLEDRLTGLLGTDPDNRDNMSRTRITRLDAHLSDREGNVNTVVVHLGSNGLDELDRLITLAESAAPTRKDPQ